jgi:hypothetical protein
MVKLFPKVQLAALAISICVIGLTYAFAVELGLKFKSSSSEPLPQPGAIVSETQSRERVEVELITLRRNGFEPVEIRRPQGPFILGVDNRSGIDGVELQLERVGGGRLPALQSRSRKLSWRELVNLPPGEYLLTEANHSNWVCAISITPR